MHRSRSVYCLSLFRNEPVLDKVAIVYLFEVGTPYDQDLNKPSINIIYIFANIFENVKNYTFKRGSTSLLSG